MLSLIGFNFSLKSCFLQPLFFPEFTLSLTPSCSCAWCLISINLMELLYINCSIHVSKNIVDVKLPYYHKSNLYILYIYNNNNNYNNKNNLLQLYSAFLETQSTLHSKGEGDLLIHHQCAASTWMMRRQPYCARTPTTHQLISGEQTVW